MKKSALFLVFPTIIGGADLAAHGATGGAIPVYWHVIQKRSTSPSKALSGELSDYPVLFYGQSARVDVAAQIPDSGYAFAEADVEIVANLPGWIRVSDGVVRGEEVLDIHAEQFHDPLSGAFADPTSPIRIWSGVYSPVSTDPGIASFETRSIAFSYYPSELTASSVETEAEPGRRLVLLNPLQLGDALVAPGEGTTLEVVDDGELVAATETQVIITGMLVPAVQKVRIGPESRPDDLTIETEINVGGTSVPTGSVTFFTNENAPTYQMDADWPLADALEYHIGFAGQTIRLRIAAVDNRSFEVEDIPNVYSSRVSVDRRAGTTSVISRFEYDEPIVVVTPEGRGLEADSIEVHHIQNNLKQMTLGVHTVRVGVGGGGGAGKVHYSDMCCF